MLGKYLVEQVFSVKPYIDTDKTQLRIHLGRKWILTLRLSLKRLLLSLRKFRECQRTLIRYIRLAMAIRTSGEQKQYSTDTTIP